MKNEEILKKAIEKAKKNGWGWDWCLPKTSPSSDDCWLERCEQWVDDEEYFSLIFLHQFAKAFWGEEWTGGMKEYKGKDGSKGFKKVLEWEWRLQYMVLEKKPLKYLEKFL